MIKKNVIFFPQINLHVMFMFITTVSEMKQLDLLSYLLESTIFTKPEVPNDNLQSIINEDFVTFMKQNDVKTIVQQLQATEFNEKSELISYIGVASLQLFVGVNWLGDSTDSVTEAQSCEVLKDVLIEDGDSVAAPVKNLHLLLIAKLIFVDSLSDDEDNLALLTWALRCCCVVATVLDEKSDKLMSQASNIISLAEKIIADEPEVSTKLKTLFYLQCAGLYRIYYRVKDAEKMTDEAARVVGISLSETGALGRRTKFQTKDIAQFCVDVANVAETSVDDLINMDRAELATDVRLEDELRLERIKFREEREEEVVLSGLQQCVLVSRYSGKVSSAAVLDSLACEELLPYLAPVLLRPQSWSLHMACLLARSRVESREGRTVERSLAQVETCLENIKLPGQQQADRRRLVYISSLAPVWEVERVLGKMLISLGLTKAALEVFIRLEQWEEVIICYTLLELRHKAAEVIKMRLEEQESARLWCLLGDATDDLQCYHKALTLSNKKSARAWRSLGLHHYFQKQYQECIPLFEKSLELSSCQPQLILRLAFSAMEINNWELAARSYRNYCSYEMDNFEAWNNLANCYVKLGEKERAWRVLQESVRCDFENWKVWDNLMLISLDIGAFNDVIRSYNRILDIKQIHVDNQVISLITRAVLENMEDVEGVGAARLKMHLQKLLARLTMAMPKVIYICF